MGVGWRAWPVQQARRASRAPCGSGRRDTGCCGLSSAAIRSAASHAKPRQATRSFHGTGKAAGSALSPLVAEDEAGRFNRTSATVGQLLDKWLEAPAVSQRPRTVYQTRRKIEGRLRPALGDVRLDKLEADAIDACGCRESHPSRSTGLSPIAK